MARGQTMTTHPRYYFAANKFEGCGHRHRTRTAARRCLPRIDPTRGPVRVYAMGPGKP
jgi:hypothetical protein